MATLFATASAMTLATVRAAEPLPENLASRAVVTASSEFSGNYLAKFAVDGKLPAAEGQADLDQAWCVQGDVARNNAQLDFQWDQPVKVSEIIYFGRTAWFLSECWKDFEVYLDGAAAPVAKGTLVMADGPQRIALPEASVKKLTLKFLSSYGGPNPGASEIVILAASPSSHELARLSKSLAAAARGAEMPWVDAVDVEKLRGLITDLMQRHGPDYGQGPGHLARLTALNEALAEAARRSEGPTALDPATATQSPRSRH